MNRTTPSMMLLAALFACTAAQAQTAAPAPAPAAAPASPFSFNVGLVTDYRFRGISQTRLKPALQGGVDFAHDSGFYLGVWASTIKILEDIPGGKGPVEIDIYGGYKGKINDTFSYDLGLLRYQYPRENFATTVNTTELYGALTAGPATIKYSHSIGKQTFGLPDSRGSYYLEAAATFETGIWGLTVTPHIGYQKYKGAANDVATYTDYSIALGKDLGGGFTVSATLVGTDADKGFYASPANGKFLGKTGLVVGAKYTF